MSYSNKQVHLYELTNAKEMVNATSMIKSRIDPTFNPEKQQGLIFMKQINCLLIFSKHKQGKRDII